MAVELFANQPQTTVSSGGTTAPASGTPESWTVASSAPFPAASSGASPPTQFHVADSATATASELIAVTNVSGGVWTVTRGAESTTPVAHQAGFTVYQVVSAGGLGTFAQAGAGDIGGTGVAPTVVSTHLSAGLPVAQGGTGQVTQQAAINALAGAQTSGDYLRGNGTNVQMSAIQAADVPQLATYAPTGLTGATAASSYAGATASGAPVSGTFAVGNFVIDQTGKVWICTVAGSPGTWTAAGPTIPVTIAQGGTGQTAQQAAMDALAGAQTSGDYLRGNGTHVVMAAIQAGDVPTLNQSTTGTAANVTGTVAIANGGTGQTGQQAAINALAGAQTSGDYLRGNGTNVQMSAIQAADVPTLNQNTTGTAANITDTLDQVPAPAADVSMNGHALTGAKDVAVSGLTGATAASRHAGATASGAPATGTFAVGDFVIDQTGKVWVCTVAGTPGTWAAGGGVTSVTAGDSSVVIGGSASVPTVASTIAQFAQRMLCT